MSTSRQDAEFINDIIVGNLPSSLLELASEWIVDNLEPDEVFKEKDLISWAEGNDFIHKKHLDDWALENGYVKE